MNKDNINISKIETYLHSLFDNVVSENTYVGTLPSTIESDWDDMCLIDCGTTIADLNAYGYGVVLIWLYAKPMLNGTKNVNKMSELEQKLNNAIAKSDSKTYQINRRNTYIDYDNERKWHCNIVEINLTIY